MAFAPDYQTSGEFYVNYTAAPDGTTHIARGTVSADPDIANPTLTTVLTISQSDTHHNGGWIGFGPNDGYLYIASGDDTDPSNGQDINTLLGKILRIDVSGGGGYSIPPDKPFVGIEGDDEIWALGLRNPWRASFDRVTGDLWIADVGDASREEVSFQPGSSPGGENYGYACKEGTRCTGMCPCEDPSFIDPIHEYTHDDGCSITGGYVYRGCAIPDLRGTYFFADWCNSRIWSFRYDGGVVTEFQERTTELGPPGGLVINHISSFGEDARGEIYIADHGWSGEVYKIVPAGPADPPTPNDYDNDGDVDLLDLSRLVECFGGPDIAFDDCLCDVFDQDADADVDLTDFATFQRAFTGSP